VRLARQAQPVYEELVEALRESTVVHADETGWRIGTLSAWLWVFTNQETTVYTIRRGRGHKVVLDILGTEFAGILNTDCLLACDAKALDDWLKQKCAAYLLRNLRDIEVSKTRGFTITKNQKGEGHLGQKHSSRVGVGDTSGESDQYGS
jgi:hypothetical protein